MAVWLGIVQQFLILICIVIDANVNKWLNLVKLRECALFSLLNYKQEK